MQKVKKLSFQKNDNDKFLALHFVCIFPNSFKFESDEIIQIEIRDMHFCFATICKSENYTLQSIVDAGYNFIDQGLDAKDYYNYLHQKYSKNKWWKDYETSFKVLWLKKLVQLNLFENYDNLTNLY